MVTPRRFASGLVIAALLLIGAAAAQDKPALPKSELSPLLTIRGAHSMVTAPTYLRITSAKEFQAVYHRHLGQDPDRYDEYYNPHGVPEIDFDRCMVVAVFQGKGWNSAGVYVHSVTQDSAGMRVRFDDRSYQTAGAFNSGDDGAEAVTAFGFFVMPKSDKAVVLEENVQSVIRDPPEWKEQARFEALAAS